MGGGDKNGTTAVRPAQPLAQRPPPSHKKFVNNHFKTFPDRKRDSSVSQISFSCNADRNTDSTSPRKSPSQAWRSYKNSLYGMGMGIQGVSDPHTGNGGGGQNDVSAEKMHSDKGHGMCGGFPSVPPKNPNLDGIFSGLTSAKDSKRYVLARGYFNFSVPQRFKVSTY